MGADVGLHVGKNFLDSFPERTYSAKLIVKLNEAKRLGEKTGSGFYQYDRKRKAKPDPFLAPIVEASRKVCARRPPLILAIIESACMVPLNSPDETLDQYDAQGQGQAGSSTRSSLPPLWRRPEGWNLEPEVVFVSLQSCG